MKKISIYILVALLASACLRLDSNLFNNQALSEYQFDAYQGESEFVLDASYDIAPSKIHLFSLQSDPEGENLSIYATYVGDIDRIATDTVILFCHGNYHHMDYYWPRTKLLANAGGKHRFGILTFDYRGFGRSEGRPSEEGMYKDAEAAVRWLQSHGLTDDRLIIYGYSLGSAPATNHTANPVILKPSKLILEAPFASSEVMVKDGAVLSMPRSYFTNYKIANAEEIKKVQQPFMWIHGINDGFLSYHTHGTTVFNNYQGSYKIDYSIERADHSDVPVIMGYDNYLDAFKNFITTNISNQ